MADEIATADAGRETIESFLGPGRRVRIELRGPRVVAAGVAEVSGVIVRADLAGGILLGSRTSDKVAYFPWGSVLCVTSEEPTAAEIFADARRRATAGEGVS